MATIGDYGSGISVDGGDVSHSVALIDDAPLIFPYRFGGIFSMFNTYHFAGARFDRYGDSSTVPARLGSVLTVRSNSVGSTRTGGYVNVGLLSSSATLRWSDRKKFSVLLSGRISYIDQFYKKLLKGSGTTLGYGFGDLNLTANYSPDRKNLITLNLFHNNDHLTALDSNYAIDTHLKWRNTLASLRWLHEGSLTMRWTAYCSAFSNRMDIDLPQFQIGVPNALVIAGMKGVVTTGRFWDDRGVVDIGIDAEYDGATPQWAIYNDGIDQREYSRDREHALSGHVAADLTAQTSSWLSLSTGVSIRYFSQTGSGSKGYLTVDPRVSVTAECRAGIFSIRALAKTQFLHQVGFSEIGLASNFWTVSGSTLAPQRSIDFSVSWQKYFPFGIIGEGSVYYNVVRHQPEYVGQLFDLLDASYSFRNHLSVAGGYNYGLTVGIRKDFGKFNGTLNYSYGVARRHLPGENEWWNNVTDPGHSLNVTANWNIDRRWNVGAHFVFGSGRVYTPVRTIYMIAENLIMEYGERNSSRLPDYHRLDLNATYRFKSGGRFPLRHSVNFGIINLYGNRNIELQYYSMRQEKGEMIFYLKRVSSLYRFLPSVSYSIEW